MIIHGNAREKAELLHKLLVEERITGEIPIATFGSVIGTHLGAGSIALAYIPIV